jgi:transposase
MEDALLPTEAMMSSATVEATARSLRALFDLPTYLILRVDRWAGWGRLSLVARRSAVVCPRCRGPAVAHPFRWRPLRDLDIGRRHIELRVQVYRSGCATCARPVLPVSMARSYSRCTRRLERQLFSLTRDSTVKAVAARMALDWETVKDAEIRHIRGLLRKRDLSRIRRIGIDEVSYQSGHRYLTLVTDLDGRRVIYVTHHNDSRAIGRFLKWFGPARSALIRVAVTDIHDPYLKGLRSGLPRASFVFDHFHVSKIVHEALDEIRRRLQRELSPDDRRVIKGQRYVLLRARENLTVRQHVSLHEILRANTDLTSGYVLKEAFREVFTAENLRTGRKRLKEWERQVQESKVPELLAVLEMIERRRAGIEAFFRYGASNGMAEGFNNVVGTIKKQAYGFHDRDYLRLKLLRVCGKIE